MCYVLPPPPSHALSVILYLLHNAWNIHYLVALVHGILEKVKVVNDMEALESTDLGEVKRRKKIYLFIIFKIDE